MPEMNGTSPRKTKLETGRVHGTHQRKGRRLHGMEKPGIGAGHGCGYGRMMGFCRFTGTENRESLIARKNKLQKYLADVEKRLEKTL